MNSIGPVITSMYLGGQVMAARKKFDVQYPNLYGKLDNMMYILCFTFTYIILTISFNSSIYTSYTQTS